MPKNLAKLVNQIILLLYLTGCVVITAVIFITGRERFVLSLLSPMFLFVPVIMERVFKLKQNYIINISYYVYVFFAYCIGVTLGVYLSSQIYDKVVHLFCGVLFFNIGAYVYELTNGCDENTNKKAGAHSIFFSLLFSLASGYLWEIYEYIYSLITGEDIQWVAKSGVSDTMQDMICCLAGASIMVAFYIYRLRFSHKNEKSG